MAKYLNLDFWFYQIYLLLQSAYNFILYGPQPVFSTVMVVISVIGSFIFFGIFLYAWYKTKMVWHEEEQGLLASFEVAKDPKSEQAEEWLDILDHVDSDNEAQWKLALIDADKVLEDQLAKAGFVGEGVGEKLKSAETQGGLRTVQDAWEAHKTRNRIAHETGFVLTKREAKIAVESYKKVFEELDFLPS